MGLRDRFQKKSDNRVENLVNLLKARREFGQKAWELTKKSDPGYSGKDERINKSIIGRVAHVLSTRGSTGIWLAMADIEEAAKAGEITYKEARTLKNKILDAASKDPTFKKVIGFGRDVKDIGGEIGGAARTGAEYYGRVAKEGGRAIGRQAANEYRYLAGTPVGKATGKAAVWTRNTAVTGAGYAKDAAVAGGKFAYHKGQNEWRREAEALGEGRLRYTDAVGNVASQTARGFGLYSKIGGAGLDAKRIQVQDPKVRSAINKGLVKLRKRASHIYKERFEGEKKAASILRKQMDMLQKKFNKRQEEAKKIATGGDKDILSSMTGSLGGNKAQLAGQLGDIVGGVIGGGKKGQDIGIIRDNMKLIIDEYTALEKKVEAFEKKDPETVQEDMKKELESEAMKIATEMIAEMSRKERKRYMG